MDRRQAAFVGREAELALLEEALGEAVGGRAQTVLVSGGPGIGKTRLAVQLAAAAATSGCAVSWGQCYPGDGAVPLWPWRRPVAEALQVCEMADPAVLAPVTGAAAEGPDRTDELGASSVRFRLFSAVADLLQGAGERRPALVVLDDLHWADVASLLLLEFVCREARDARLLVLGLLRPADEVGDPELRGYLDRLLGASTVRHVALPGLSTEQVAQCAQALTGRPVPAELASELTGRTGGNPFFVTEVLRAIDERGVDAAAALRIAREEVPPQVAAALRARLADLAPTVSEVLLGASVVGLAFRADVVRLALDVPGQQLLEALDVAQRRELVRPGRDPAAGRFAFTHALVREALYDAIPAARRAQLHDAVSRALERLATGEGVAAEIAHHCRLAAGLGEGAVVARTVRFSVAAAREATRRLAYEDAVRHQRDAVEMSRRAAFADVHRCELALELGEAQNRVGDTSGAQRSFLEAAEVAREAAHPQCVARAALGYRLGVATGSRIAAAPDQDLVRLLREALDGLPPEAGETRASLLARLAIETAFGSSEQERTAMLDEAWGSALASQNRRLQAEVLLARHIALWRPDRLEVQTAAVSSAVTTAVELGDVELEAQARYWRVTDLLALGEMADADVEMDLFDRLADQLRQPLYLWWSMMRRAMRAALRGDLAGSEQLAGESARAGMSVKLDVAVQAYGAQLLRLRWAQDRLAEMSALVNERAAEHPESAVWQIARVFVAAQTGAEAGEQLAALVRDQLPLLPRNSLWAGCAGQLAETAAIAGDADTARRVYEALAWNSGRWMTIGPATSEMGPADRMLGLLALRLGDLDAAQRHLESARALAHRAGAPGWVASVDVARARVLASRGSPQDDAAARRLAADAAAVGRRLGLQQVQRDAADALRQLGARAAAGGGATSLTRRESEVLQLARAGASARVIGERLFISPRTAEAHLASIYAKLGVRSRAELMATAAEQSAGPGWAADEGDDERAG